MLICYSNILAEKAEIGKRFYEVRDMLSEKKDMRTKTGLIFGLAILLACAIGAQKAPAQTGWDYYQKAIQLQKDDKSVEAIAEFKLAVEKEPENAFYHNALGLAYIDTGNFEASFEELSRAVELDPNLPEAYSGLGICHNAKGDYNKSIEVFKRALELTPENNPDRAVILNNIGQNYYLLKQYDEAEKQLKAALELNDKLLTAYINLGNVYTERGDYETAVKYHEKAVELVPDYPLPRNNLAFAYYKLGRYDEALKQMEVVLASDPDNEQFKRNYEFLKAEKERREQGIYAEGTLKGLPKEVTLAPQEERRQQPAEPTSGEIVVAESAPESTPETSPRPAGGKPEEAPSATPEAATPAAPAPETTPESKPRPRQRVGATSAERQHQPAAPAEPSPAAAKHEAAKAEAPKPEETKPIFPTAAKPSEEKETKPAAAPIPREEPAGPRYERVQRTTPAQPGTEEEKQEFKKKELEKTADQRAEEFYNGAKYNIRIGDLDSASRDIGRALEIYPEKPDYLIVKGMIEERRGYLYQAAAIYRAVLEKNPDNSTALNSLGYVHQRLNMIDLAEGEYKKAFQADNRNGCASGNLGSIMVLNGNCEKGREMLASAVENGCINAAVLNNVSICHFESGDFGNAAQLTRRALELDPENETILANFSFVVRNTGAGYEPVHTQDTEFDPFFRAGAEEKIVSLNSLEQVVPLDYYDVLRTNYHKKTILVLPFENPRGTGRWSPTPSEVYTQRLANSIIETGYFNVIVPDEPLADVSYSEKISPAFIKRMLAKYPADIVFMGRLGRHTVTDMTNTRFKGLKKKSYVAGNYPVTTYIFLADGKQTIYNGDLIGAAFLDGAVTATLSYRNVDAIKSNAFGDYVNKVNNLLLEYYHLIKYPVRQDVVKPEKKALRQTPQYWR